MNMPCCSSAKSRNNRVNRLWLEFLEISRGSELICEFLGPEEILWQILQHLTGDGFKPLEDLRAAGGAERRLLRRRRRRIVPLDTTESAVEYLWTAYRERFENSLSFSHVAMINCGPGCRMSPECTVAVDRVKRIVKLHLQSRDRRVAKRVYRINFTACSNAAVAVMGMVCTLCFLSALLRVPTPYGPFR